MRKWIISCVQPNIYLSPNLTNLIMITLLFKAISGYLSQFTILNHISNISCKMYGNSWSDANHVFCVCLCIEAHYGIKTHITQGQLVASSSGQKRQNRIAWIGVSPKHKTLLFANSGDRAATPNINCVIPNQSISTHTENLCFIMNTLMTTLESILM